jgi:hypothetical protein
MRYEPMSRPLSIDMPEDQFSTLSRLALQQGKSPEQLAQEVLSRGIQELESDRLLKWLGAIESDTPDAAERHDHYIGEELYRELKDEPRI